MYETETSAEVPICKLWLVDYKLHAKCLFTGNTYFAQKECCYLVDITVQ